MRCKFKYLILTIFTFVAIVFITTPTKVNAQSLSGYFNMYYVKSTNYGTIPTNYTSTLGFSYPTTSYTQLAGSTITGNNNTNQFSVITQAQLQANFNFVKGNYYVITLNFDTGSYVIPYFPTNNSNWFVSSCTNSLCNTTPDVIYTYTIDTTHTSTNSVQVVIKFTATATASNPIITIGNLTDNKGIFYNQYSVQQGIRISSSTIDVTEQSVDLTPIVDAQNQTTNAINDINDTLTDSNVTANAQTGIFDNIDLFEDNTLSGIMTAPLTYLRSIDGTCTPITLTYKSQDITLPCGTTIFWARPDVSTFRTFWNILFGGFIIYRLCFKLFKTINNALDPTKDDVGGVAV